MANNRIQWEGLAELRELLRKLPAELRGEGSAIVNAWARQAFEEIYKSYPIGPGSKRYAGGNLRKGLSISTGDTHSESVGKGGNFGYSVLIKNRAKHAWIFENGSEARRVSRKVPGRAGNFGTSRGSMPPGRVFVPIVIRKRAAMNLRLRQLLIDHGLLVVG